MNHPTIAMSHSDLDVAYHVLERAIALRIAADAETLFTTSADPEELWGRYLAEFPKEHRATYLCNNCRHFIQRYGGLVTIGEEGGITPFLWDNLLLPDAMQSLAESLGALVTRSRVNGVFRWPNAVWGTPSNVSAKTGATWTHLHGLPSVNHVRRDATPEQQMAALREDVGILQRSLDDYSLAAVEEAARVLTSGALTRSEKAEGVATWFLALHQAIAANPRARHNLVWRAVASAPPGFAHVRSTVLSTLLDDIVAGLSFAEVSRRWAEKLHPLQYQRPTAPARAGQIDAAEKKVKALRIDRSFLRRFATLDDVLVKLWEPRPVAPVERAGGGVFDALRESTDKVKALELPTQTVTWRKFAESVLPDALTIEIEVPSHGGFYGLTTATDPEAPAILQWDGLEGHVRNPVAWYFYAHGSSASQWALRSGWAAVSALFPSPPQWQEPSRFGHQRHSIFFAIVGAQDRTASGLALFPETLRAELRDIRTVVEHYSGITQLTGRELANANGLAFDGGKERIRLRVTSARGIATYTLDRWE